MGINGTLELHLTVRYDLISVVNTFYRHAVEFILTMNAFGHTHDPSVASYLCMYSIRIRPLVQECDACVCVRVVQVRTCQSFLGEIVLLHT